MPGLTATLTAPYEASINKLLDPSTSKPTDQEIIQELSPENVNGSALESAFRNEFYRVLNSTDIDDDDFERMWRLLDVVNVVADEKACEPGLLFLLIEDLLESQTTHGCRKVFDYLESRRERIIAKNWLSKHLALLRSCNELLRRLSRAEDTVFCGRVFIFLFQSFPLGDKSSVNLRGEYHTDNVTHYDQTPIQPEDEEAMAVDSAKLDVAQAAPTIKLDGKETVDTNVLYSTFWSMQEYFAQPTKLFESSNLGTFKSGMEKTMLKFREVYREEPRSGPRPDQSKGTKRKLDDLDGNAFNPKYLTSRDMFELELHDPAFRRHILVQALIVIDFLLLQTSKAKSNIKDYRNKSVIYDFTLDEEGEKWATGMRADIASYLQQGTEGKYYYRMVDNVLSRDKNWMRWKAVSCPPFSLKPVAPEEFASARTSLQKAAAPRVIRKAPMGALDLGFLNDHEQADPLERYQNPERWRLPDLAKFRDEIAVVDMDLEMPGDEEASLKEQRSSKVWRALRIGGRFSVLDKIDTEGRDGLDPLFGISKEPEVNDDGNTEAPESEERAASEMPAGVTAQLDGADDQPESAVVSQVEAEEARPEGAEGETPQDTAEVADEMEGQEATAAETTQIEDEIENGDEDPTRSAESPLSSVDSETLNVDNSWVESAEGETEVIAENEGREEEGEEGEEEEGEEEEEEEEGDEAEEET